MKTPETPYISTTNACKLCKPLGACLAFRGIEGAVPFLHGSQGCATYMRRYVISHFREPMDIASSSLGEKHAIYGGGPNLKQGLMNVMAKYGAGLIGVASTCLTETIGDDMPGLVREFQTGAGRGGVAGDRHGLHPQLQRHPHGRFSRRGQGGGGADGPRRRADRGGQSPAGFRLPGGYPLLEGSPGGFRASRDHPAGFFRDPGRAGPAGL